MIKRPMVATRGQMTVTLAVNPPFARPTPVSLHRTLSEQEPLPETPRQARIRRAREQQQQEEFDLATRNQDITQLQDPLAELDLSHLIEVFQQQKASSAATLTEHLLKESGILAGIQEVSAILSNLIGESAVFQEGQANQHVERIFELKFLELFTKAVKLNPRLRAHLLRNYVNREWGPRPLEQKPVIVKVERESPNSRAAIERNGRRTEKAEKTRPPPGTTTSRSSSGSFNPFGKL